MTSAALAALAVMALLVCVPAARAEPPLTAVKNDLVTMNFKLSLLIKDGEQKRISGQKMRDGIEELKLDKRRLMKNFPSVFGLSSLIVYSDLEDVSNGLLEAERALIGKDDGKAALKLEEAKRAKQKLEARFRAKPGVPDSVLTGLQKLDQNLTATIGELKSGKSSVTSTFDLMLELSRINDPFPHVFGVPWGTVYSDLFDVDNHLDRAFNDTFGFLFDNPGAAVEQLKEAKKAKDQLEQRFNEASSVCTTKGLLARTAASCPAPKCKSGSFTSSALMVTAPSQPQGAQYFFKTPIPNWLYYNHKHGFTSGGCDHEQGKVLVNIELLNFSNQPVAWTLEYGPGISPGPGQAPIMVYSGNACPFVQSGQTFDGCRIDNPELAYPLPSEGYLGTFSGDASTFRNYAATIDVHPAAMVGSSDTLHVLVAWKLP